MILSNCLPLQEILLQNLGKAKPLRTCIVTISLSHLTYPHLFNGSLLDRSHHDVRDCHGNVSQSDTTASRSVVGGVFEFIVVILLVLLIISLLAVVYLSQPRWKRNAITVR